MSDLFHEDVPDDYIVAVAASCSGELAHLSGADQAVGADARLLANPARGSPRSCRTSGGASAWRTASTGLPRIEHLRAAPAAVRFLSVEPLLEDLGDVDLTGIHWVIVGGESGPGARPMRKEWVLALRQAMRTPSNIPFFFKQWGGVQKSKAGREIDGATCDGVPPPARMAPPDDAVRRAAIAEVAAWKTPTG